MRHKKRNCRETEFLYDTTLQFVRIGSVYGGNSAFPDSSFFVREGWGQEAFYLTVKKYKKWKTDVNNKQMLSDIYIL